MSGIFNQIITTNTILVVVGSPNHTPIAGINITIPPHKINCETCVYLCGKVVENFVENLKSVWETQNRACV